MTPENKRTILWLTAILMVAAGLLAVVFLPSNEARWEALRNRTTKLKRDAMTRKSPRTVLRGDPLPGNAWQEYNVALAAPWPKDTENGSIFYRFASGDKSADTDRVRKMVAEQQPLLEHLRRGAQKSDGQYPYDWDKGAEVPSLLRSRMLANLAMAQAKVLMEDGKSQTAANLLLDLTAFGRDLSTNGPLLAGLIGVAVYEISFEGLGRLIQSGQLTRDQLSDLATKLDAVEHDLPTVRSTLSNETLGTGTAILQLQAGDDRAWRERAKVGGWRFVVFPQETMLDAFEQHEAFVQRFENINPANYSEARKQLGAISADVEASPNGVVRELTPSLLRIAEVHLEMLTQLRLVQAAARLRATGKMPTIADPFGKNLFFKEEGDKVKIWSVGMDGKNQEGAGKFDRSGADIVLEIPR
jgi:hypothetical protein